MGLDARMFAKTRLSLSEAEIRDIGYRLGEAVGPGRFFHDRIDVGPDGEELRRYGCVQRVAALEIDGREIAPEPGESILQIHVFGRFYGEGYERGDPWVYVAVAEFLEANVPDCAVWYGGDSGAIALFDRAARADLVRHWAASGGRPYEEGFDRQGHAPAPFRPVSRAYGKPMIRFGWGRDYAAFRCPASGEQQEWSNGVWQPAGKNRNGEAVTGDPVAPAGTAS